jgi:butyryl-CoA dehydrogenase
MASLLLSRRDLDFLLHEWLDVESLTKRPRYADHSRETFDDVLDLAEQIATEHFAPHNRLSDAHEPVFDGQTVTLIPEIAQALEVFGEAGLLAGTLDEELGGLQLPAVVGQAVFGWFQARTSARAATRSSRSPTPTCCWRTARRSRSRPTSARWSRAASSARCACPSRRPARRCPT